MAKPLTRKPSRKPSKKSLTRKAPSAAASVKVPAGWKAYLPKSPEVKLQTLIDEIREIRDEKGVDAWKNKDKDHWVAYQMLRGGTAAVIIGGVVLSFGSGFAIGKGLGLGTGFAFGKGLGQFSPSHREDGHYYSHYDGPYDGHEGLLRSEVKVNSEVGSRKQLASGDSRLPSKCRIGGTPHIPLHKTLIQLKTTPEIKKWLLKPSNRIARLFLQYPTIGKSLAMILGALGVYAGFRVGGKTPIHLEEGNPYEQDSYL